MSDYSKRSKFLQPSKLALVVISSPAFRADVRTNLQLLQSMYYVQAATIVYNTLYPASSGAKFDNRFRRWRQGPIAVDDYHCFKTNALHVKTDRSLLAQGTSIRTSVPSEELFLIDLTIKAVLAPPSFIVSDQTRKEPPWKYAKPNAELSEAMNLYFEDPNNFFPCIMQFGMKHLTARDLSASSTIFQQWLGSSKPVSRTTIQLLNDIIKNTPVESQWIDRLSEQDFVIWPDQSLAGCLTTNLCFTRMRRLSHQPEVEELTYEPHLVSLSSLYWSAEARDELAAVAAAGDWAAQKLLLRCFSENGLDAEGLPDPPLEKMKSYHFKNDASRRAAATLLVNEGLLEEAQKLYPCPLFNDIIPAIFDPYGVINKSVDSCSGKDFKCILEVSQTYRDDNQQAVLEQMRPHWPGDLYLAEIMFDHHEDHIAALDVLEPWLEKHIYAVERYADILTTAARWVKRADYTKEQLLVKGLVLDKALMLHEHGRRYEYKGDFYAAIRNNKKAFKAYRQGDPLHCMVKQLDLLHASSSLRASVDMSLEQMKQDIDKVRQEEHDRILMYFEC
eukprot:TRINITY_DN8090_c0_g1_i1.p1 TRINITY_DN8090_c0_g1~~TRINITY_DN8090_c0_g1_i1.p1  ORF type:complete len:560 (+),score=72.62 TRINITY_DN8090_c0_g1_i1:78-1757(+)